MKRNWKFALGILLVPVLCSGFALSPMGSVWIKNSLIDSTPIGQTTPAAATFTTATATTFNGNLNGNASSANSAGSANIANTANAANTANTANSLAATPSTCGGSPATGINANGNAICASGGATNFQYVFTGCSIGTGQPSRCLGTFSLPANMPDSNYVIVCTTNSNTQADSHFTLQQPTPLPTSAGSVLTYAIVQTMQNSTSGSTPVVMCLFHHD